MIVRTCTIRNRLGLHARAASLLVQVAQNHGASVTLRNGDQSANAKSIMSVLMLQASQGTEITLEASGDDAERAIEAISELIDDLFGEPD